MACLVAAFALTPSAVADPSEPAPASSTSDGSTRAWTLDEDSPVGDHNDTPLSGTRLDQQLTVHRSRLAKGRRGLRRWASDTYTEDSGYSDTVTLLKTLGQRAESGATPPAT